MVDSDLQPSTLTCNQAYPNPNCTDDEDEQLVASCRKNTTKAGTRHERDIMATTISSCTYVRIHIDQPDAIRLIGEKIKKPYST